MKTSESSKSNIYVNISLLILNSALHEFPLNSYRIFMIFSYQISRKILLFMHYLSTLHNEPASTCLYCLFPRKLIPFSKQNFPTIDSARPIYSHDFPSTGKYFQGFFAHIYDWINRPETHKWSVSIWMHKNGFLEQTWEFACVRSGVRSEILAECVGIDW